MEKVNFTDFFDIDNDEHIVAFHYLILNGVWPENLINKNEIEMDKNWQVTMALKIMYKVIQQRINKLKEKGLL
jgi:hypothetical protein